MSHSSKKIILISVISALLSACGGGGGGGGGDAPQPKSNQQVTPSQEVADISCNGSTCALPASAGASLSGSVYQYHNASTRSQMLTLSGPMTVHWKGVITQVSADAAYSPRIAGAKATDSESERKLQQELDAFYGKTKFWAGLAKQVPAHARVQARIAAARAYALDDTRQWFDTISQSQLSSRLKASQALPNGGMVYVWAQDGVAPVSSEQANFLAERFANSVHPIESAVISEPWGPVHADWRNGVIDSASKDVHLVLAQLNQPASAFKGLLGYVFPANAMLKSMAQSAVCQQPGEDCSAIANSNEALVTFINVDTLVAKDANASAWTAQSAGASLALSTLAHEYQHILYSYNKLYRRSLGTPVSSTWEDELAAQTMGYLVSADTYGGGRGDSSDAHPDLRSGGDFSRFLSQPACDMKAWSSRFSCYPKALAAGMLMLHQYGAGVMKPWVTGPNTGERALNDGLAAVGGGNYGSLMQRLSSSLALAGNSPWPKGFGFPAAQLQLASGKTIRLPQVNIAQDEVGWSKNSASETYALDMSVAGSGLNVWLPANARLSLIKP